jgi:release factor glutamine methyltransferase
MKQTIDYIHSELSGLYPPREVDQFVALLLRHVCGMTRADIIVHKDRVLPENLTSEIHRFTLRLKQYEPIQYVFGSAPFLDYEFRVTPAVLIPRPETEELVELITAESPESGLRVLDVGTGSGCIASSLALRLKTPTVTAFDVSPDALAVARDNADRLGADVAFREVDILTFDASGEAGAYDVIVSNPPYVCDSERAEMEPNVLRYEPELALFVPDADPLRFYRRIAELGLTLLTPGGRLYFEINARFGRETEAMLAALGYTELRTLRDIHGRERITSARKPNSNPAII